jgi:hypothetical protein
LKAPSPMFITLRSKHTTLIHKCWVMTGYDIRAMRSVGGWEGTSWGVRYLTTGRQLTDG